MIRNSHITLHIVLFCWMLLLTANVLSQGFQLLSSKETGIKFRNDIVETENLNVLAYEYFYNGGGVAVGDINNDNLPDLFFTGNMGANKLYLNQGTLKFKDITKEAGAELAGRKDGWKTGVTMADVNGDGWLDIYVCYSGKRSEDFRRNQLFINKGDGTFSEQAKEFGVDDPGYGTQAAFFDFDNDNDLDLYLLNHSTKKIDNMELAKFRSETDVFAGSKLLENKDNHFIDVSEKAGIHRNPLTFGLGIAISDINKDGWQDIYVTNDYNEPDYLYLNNKDGSFTDATKKSLRHIAQFSMGVDIADYNNDALPDIISLDMLPPDNRRQKLLQLQENYESFELMQKQDLHNQYMRNMLQLNNGDGTFSEIAQQAGVAKTDWSWCPLLADFDNDGFKDLFVTTGYLRDYTNKDFLRYWGDYKVKKAIESEPVLLMDLIKQMPVTVPPNFLFKNEHNLTFSDKGKEWGIKEPLLSNGAIYSDLDNDGDLDLVLNNINENAAIYKNLSSDQKSAHFISIKLQYKAPNGNAIGAAVYVYQGNNIQYQEVNPNRGYLSSVSTVLNFGLGNAASVDSIRIVWPDASNTILKNTTANQALTISYNQSVKSPAPGLNKAIPLFTEVKNVLKYTHENFPENDFKRQLLMLFMYSKTGPVIAKADVNNDKLEDLYISGDKNKPGGIYLQQKEGDFKLVEGMPLNDENYAAVSDAQFFDANNDGLVDLYLAKGGYSQFTPGTAALQDDLYLNTGNNKFVLSKEALPDVSTSSKSCIRPCDFDNDGDMDVFIGGRIVPGSYPETPESFLLVNDGKAKFTKTPAPFTGLGMVTDAQWTDLDNDGRKDLVIAGEMMPIYIFSNTQEGFIDQTTSYFKDRENGCWLSLCITDVNNDGRPDIIAGNLGLNNQLKVSPEKPAELVYDDFDANGSIDPFFNFYIGDTSYPFVSRDELNEQIYPMRRKFNSYANYASATMKEIFSAEELSKAKKLVMTETKSTCYLNKGNKFEKVVLPAEAQFSIVTKIISDDFTKDGHPDLLLFGNHSDNRLKMGSIDANFGCLLAGDGKGGFTYIEQPKSGFSVTGDVKSAGQVFIQNNRHVYIGITDKGVEFYKLNQGKIAPGK
ncbi:MAG: VCBS repeat-containing protein [Bacteroidota bacterium]